jgi:hypothetical protein
MIVSVFKRVSIITKKTIFTLAIFLVSIWSLTFYASRLPSHGENKIFQGRLEYRAGGHWRSSLKLWRNPCNEDVPKGLC